MIGKLTIDKSSMNLSFFLYTIDILRRNRGQISRTRFVEEMAEFVGVAPRSGGKENRTAYNKNKLPRYFGFVDIKSVSKNHDDLVLTPRGRVLAKYIWDTGVDKKPEERFCIKEECKEKFQDLIFESVLLDSFGKNNSGAEQSRTDVEPPKVVFKTIYALEKASAEEICYVMFGLNRGEFSDFSQALEGVKDNRKNGFTYTETMTDWGIGNIVDDCKVIKIFADKNIALLVSEVDETSGITYYQFSDWTRNNCMMAISNMSVIYEPLQLFVYREEPMDTMEYWVDGTILGGVGNESQVIQYKSQRESYLRSPQGGTEGGASFQVGAFETAVLTAFQSPEKNVYLLVEQQTETEFFSDLGTYASLLQRRHDLKSEQHGWSKTPLIEEGFHQWLVENSKFANEILEKNEVLVPSNLHIVGVIVMEKEATDVEFEYEFRRCLVKEEETVLIEEYVADESKRVAVGRNILLYGVPGSGKSWTIANEYCKKGSVVERVVFHPDYTYSDFIGQILPNVDGKGQVTYEFTAGPFTSILKQAYENMETEYILIIEEINRGNAPAIFGEIFQLLDRLSMEVEGFPVGSSAYGITNANIAKVVYGNPSRNVRIPSNLSILGTMNTSDQNVFTLDTAFQRRWDMRMVENSFDHVSEEIANAEILDTTVTWEQFCTTVNDIVVSNSMRMSSSEDKRLGTYFISTKDLEKDTRLGNLTDGEYDSLRAKEREHTLSELEKIRLSEIREALGQYRKFPEKVIKYLWDDAFKFHREVLFETTKYPSLEAVIRGFLYAEGLDRFQIFKENVVSRFCGEE